MGLPWGVGGAVIALAVFDWILCSNVEVERHRRKTQRVYDVSRVRLARKDIDEVGLPSFCQNPMFRAGKCLCDCDGQVVGSSASMSLTNRKEHVSRE